MPRAYRYTEENLQTVRSFFDKVGWTIIVITLEQSSSSEILHGGQQ